MSLMESTARQVNLVNYNLSKHILGMMMMYVISSNKSIRRSHLMNMMNLFNTYDPKAYESDNEKKEMIDFIKKGLDARLTHNLTDPQLILYQIKGHITDTDSIDNYEQLGTSDIQWLNQMVSNTIDQAFVYKDIDNMVNICTAFKTTSNPAERAKLVEEYKEQVTKSQNVFRKNKNEVEEDEMFSLEEGIFETRVRETYDEVANPSRKLMMGNQALNELFGGGLEEGRVYTLFGLPGEALTVLLATWLSCGAGVGVAASLFSSGTITAHDITIMAPALILMASQIQYMGRLLGVANAPKKYWPLLMANSLLMAIFGMLLMRFFV